MTSDDRKDHSEPERRVEVLREALRLVAEKGIAGASLRKLAARLELSQPSLYHYFKSKDDLIDQLAEFGASHMVTAMNLGELPRLSLDELPHFIKERIFELWESEEHVLYTKFLFVVSIESPRHRALVRRVFEQRLLGDPPAAIADLLPHDPDLADRLVQALLMQARAMGLMLMEERILFGLPAPSERARSHADFIASAVVRVITG